MEKVIVVVGMLLLSISLIACSDSNSLVKAENENLYQIYTHTDEDGCEYLIVYHDEWGTNRQGIGAGITPKVKQPATCQ